MLLHHSPSLKIMHCCKHATNISKDSGSGAVTIQLHIHSNTANDGAQYKQNEQLQQQLLSRRQCLMRQMQQPSLQRHGMSAQMPDHCQHLQHGMRCGMQQQVAMMLSGICNGTDRSNTSRSSPCFIQPAATIRHANAVREPFSAFGTVIVTDVASTAVSKKLLICC